MQSKFSVKKYLKGICLTENLLFYLILKVITYISTKIEFVQQISTNNNNSLLLLYQILTIFIKCAKSLVTYVFKGLRYVPKRKYKSFYERMKFKYESS